MRPPSPPYLTLDYIPRHVHHVLDKTGEHAEIVPVHPLVGPHFQREAPLPSPYHVMTMIVLVIIMTTTKRGQLLCVTGKLTDSKAERSQRHRLNPHLFTINSPVS